MQHIICDYPIPPEIAQAEQAIIDCSNQKTFGKLRQKINEGIELYERISESISRLIGANQSTHQLNYNLLLQMKEEFADRRERETISPDVKTQIEDMIDSSFHHHVPRIEIIKSLCAAYQKKLAALKASAATKIGVFREELVVHRRVAPQDLSTAVTSLIAQATTIALQMQLFADAFQDSAQEKYAEYHMTSQLTAIQFYQQQLLPLIPGSKRISLDFFAAETFAAKGASARQVGVLLNLLDRQWKLRCQKHVLFEIKSATDSLFLKASVSVVDFTLFYLCAASGMLSPETYSIANHVLTAGTNLIVRILKSSPGELSEEMALRNFNYPALIAEKLSLSSVEKAIAELNGENTHLSRDISYLETESSFCNLAQGMLNFKFPVPKAVSAVETIFGFFVRRQLGSLCGKAGDWVRFKWATHATVPDELPTLSSTTLNAKPT